jgi:protein phosphatase
MGSRAVVVVCRDVEAARKRFGVEGESGIVVTRTGRQFFNVEELESALLERVRRAITAAGIWDEFDTSWAVLDCELMPWSAKAQELLKSQYAAVGAAACAALPPAIEALQTAAARLDGDDANALSELQTEFERRRDAARQFVAAYRHYCWPVAALDDYRLAPFHLLATEGRVHVAQNHQWHMDLLARICQQDAQLLLATPHRLVDVTDPGQVEAASEWWTELTERGGEGMVVKPLDFIAKGSKGLVQPAVKCRGREYLRIIYGPDYTKEENLARLRNRGLGAKRSLALREFALGIEALERFVRREPLRRVHECVFGVLALESEPVDPRL